MPTSGGVSITDDLVEEFADEAAEGYEVEALRHRGGRRSISSAPAKRRLRGTATTQMATDEIMGLLRDG